MRSTALLSTLRGEYPQFSFVEDDTFLWSAETKTVHIDTSVKESDLFTLHELGHALLDHQSYTQDIELLKIERDAWHYALTQLAPRYNIAIDEAIIEDNLDTYRDWLHARSLCPSCQITGLQTSQGNYSCLGCGCHWKSNDARHCALRRNKVATK